jgi:hypothetical protein
MYDQNKILVKNKLCLFVAPWPAPGPTQSSVLHSSRVFFLGGKADHSPASIFEGNVSGAISPLDLHKTSSFPTLHEVVVRTAYLVYGHAMGWTVRDSNPCGGKRMSSFHTRPEQHWGPTNLLWNRYRRSFLVEKRPRRVADHAPPSKAETNKVNSCTSTVPFCACTLCCYGETFTLHENIGLGTLP